MNSKTNKAGLIEYICQLHSGPEKRILRIWLAEKTRVELYERAQRLAQLHRIALARAGNPVVELPEPVYNDAD